MTLTAAIESALRRRDLYGSTRLVVERTDHPLLDGTTYYTIKASEKHAWTPGERCLVVVLG